MKIIVVLFLIAFTSAYSQIPRYTHNGSLKSNGKLINHLYASPGIGDWNADGKNDLLVGENEKRGVCLYLNSGTNSSPIFKSSKFLEANGKIIKLSPN